MISKQHKTNNENIEHKVVIYSQFENNVKVNLRIMILLPLTEENS
jgi:hypothetical protein